MYNGKMEDFLLVYMQSHLGSTITFIVVISIVLIEKSEIKLNPISWLGECINKSMNTRLDELEKKINKIEKDALEHQVQSWRRDILNFQDELLKGEHKTLENFNNIIDIHDKYQMYIKSNDLENGQIDEAYAYIMKEYRHLKNNDGFKRIIE